MDKVYEAYEIINNKIADILKYWDNYNLIGVRVQYEEFQLGKMDHTSSVWVDGKQTEEELDGVCTIQIDPYRPNFKDMCDYLGDHVAIICGNDGYGGEDMNELIITDPVVVEIIM